MPSSSGTDLKVDTTLTVTAQKRPSNTQLASTPERNNTGLPNPFKRPQTRAERSTQKPQQPDPAIETLKFYQTKLDEAADLWVKQKGGEATLGDANNTFLRTIQMMSHGMKLQLQLDEANKAKQDSQLEKKVQEIQEAIARDLEERCRTAYWDLYDDIFDQRGDIFQERLDVEDILSKFKEKTHLDPDWLLDEEAIELKTFLIKLKNAYKDEPENAQDVQRQHMTEIGE